MSKIISVSSLRNGVGRTTISCLLGLKLAETGFRTLIIDNNYKFCDVAYYLMIKPEYSVDDLKPFLRSGVLEKSTILSMVVKAEKNLDVLSGSTMTFVNNTLKKEDLQTIKNLVNDKYDYIVIDNRAGIEHEGTLGMIDIVDRIIVVTQPNKYEQNHYERLYKTLEKEKTDKLQEGLDKSILIYNRFTDDANIELENSKKLFADRIYKLKYSEKLLDFCNGYKCQLKDDNEKEMAKIIVAITNKITEKKPKKFTIGEKLKSIFNVF
jgi:septum site-determining protein MinD